MSNDYIILGFYNRDQICIHVQHSIHGSAYSKEVVFAHYFERIFKNTTLTKGEG